MSTQQEKLTAIADAIREKDGSTELIPANDFPARIRAIETGSSFAVPLAVTADEGTLITAVNGDDTVIGTTGTSGTVTLTLLKPGDWSVSAHLGDKTVGPTIITVEEGYVAKFSMKSRLPEGYTEVKYVESDGTAALNTGVIPTASIKFAIDAELLEAGATAKYLFYSTAYIVSQSHGYYFIAEWSNSGLRITRGGAWSTLAKSYITLSNDNTPRRMTVEIDYLNLKAFIPGEVELDLEFNSCTRNMSAITLLNNTSSKTGVKARLYSCQIELDNAMVRNFVPCTNQSGIPGLYDLAENTFYSSTGTGAFTAGPAV